MRRVLSLDRRRAIAFVVLGLIAAGGQVQGWTFSDGTVPKPPLYDLLAPLPLWEAWALLIAPLALLVLPFTVAGLDVFSAPLSVFASVQAVYLYVLACTLALIRDKWPDRRKRLRAESG